MELEITVAVAFSLSGFSLIFCFFVLLFQVVNFGFALRCCTLVTVVMSFAAMFSHILCFLPIADS